ncbi:MAG: hypothetical protein QME45_14350 [Clostridiales bacterium]|nr:hypothetical protein [Clostridiales bacterium]
MRRDKKTGACHKEDDYESCENIKLSKKTKKASDMLDIFKEPEIFANASEIIRKAQIIRAKRRDKKEMILFLAVSFAFVFLLAAAAFIDIKTVIAVECAVYFVLPLAAVPAMVLRKGGIEVRK